MLDKLLDTLEQESFQEAEQLMDRYEAQAKQTEQQLVEETKKKLALREIRQMRDLKKHEQQARKQLSMLAQQRQEALKLSAWEDILRKLGERLRHLEPAQMVEWVTQAIHQQQDPHPRIYVGTRWMQPIFTAFGRRYQVIERKDLPEGFILSYDKQDVNYLEEPLLAFEHERLLRRLAVLSDG